MKALRQVATDSSKFQSSDSEARQKLVAGVREPLNAAEASVKSLLWHIWAPPIHIARRALR